MLCPSCGHTNREGRKFCSECGAALELRCASCQSANEPGERFCGSCGAPLSAVGGATMGVELPSVLPSPPLPASFAGGRYQVKKFLGEGATKKVYLVLDTLLDRDVAFALIKAEGLDEVGRQRILREARTMARLGDHPNIMQLHDLGDENGQPYMVLPLMAGGDVDTLLRDAPDHRLPLEQAIAICKHVCSGLQFSHAKGIVHRDLKPGNVWLTSEGTAKIGDFGLALTMDRSRLTQQNMAVGTAWYMAPEQAMGADVSASADLYSLGCMLYQMVTGRPPFMGDDPIAIIGQHVNTPPVAPTWHNERCPEPLEALILRLLAKDPLGRPESASEALATLEAIDAIGVGEGGPLLPDKANVLDSLAGGVFVGRQHEIDELKAALEDALSGRGRLVMMAGEAGIGKTRTAQELATYAGMRGAQVLWGRCFEERGTPPYWPWVQAIRTLVRERDPQALRSELGAGAANIAEIVPEVRERLPGLAPPPAIEDPEQARFRLFDSITTFLTNASRGKPLALVLDDLHWADKASLMLLEFVGRELAASRIFLLGTYRDVELNRRHPLTHTLGELTRQSASGAFQRVALRGLTLEDLGRFIEVTSSFTPPHGLARAVHTQTGGNPFFATEVLRLLVQEGELRPDRASKRGSWTVRIPDSVREVVSRRLNRLSERCIQTLTVASVIGREFELRQLRGLVEDPSTGSGQAMSEDATLEVVEEALSAKVIEEMPQAVGRYQFSNILMQHTLAEELSATRRVRLHARIASSLEQLYGDAAEAHAPELAYHFGKAATTADSAKLLRYSLLAGEQASGTYAHDEALEHFRRALDLMPQPQESERARMTVRVGDIQATQGSFDAAVGSWRKAMGWYEGQRQADQVVALHRRIANALWSKGQMEESQRQLAAGLSLLESVEQASPEAAALHQELASQALHRGDIRAAVDSASKALEFSQRSQAHEQASLAATTLGIALARTGDLKAGLGSVEQALAVAKQHSLPMATARATINLAVLYSIEDPFRAAKLSEEGLAEAERIGAVALLPWFHTTLAGSLNACALDYDSSTGSAQRAIELDRRLGLRSHLPVSLIVLAQGQQCQGRFAEAEASYLEALSIAEELGDPQILFPCLEGLGMLSLEQEQVERGQAYLARARKVCDDAGVSIDEMVLLPFFY